FVDTNGNGHWDSGETVVYDTNRTGSYSAGDPVLYGSTPSAGTVLRADSKILFVDSNRNGLWDSGEAVVYDSNGNGVFDSGEPVIAGPAPPNDGSATLTIDHHFHFVDISLGGHWIQGDTVIYDADSDHVYVTGDLIITGTPPPTGTLLEEPVVAGLAPAVGTP